MTNNYHDDQQNDTFSLFGRCCSILDTKNAAVASDIRACSKQQPPPVYQYSLSLSFSLSLSHSLSLSPSRGLSLSHNLAGFPPSTVAWQPSIKRSITWRCQSHSKSFQEVWGSGKRRRKWVWGAWSAPTYIPPHARTRRQEI